MDKHSVLIPESFAYICIRCLYGQVVLKKKMIKRDLGNCESGGSLRHIKYTVTVMIIVSLCLNFFAFFFFCVIFPVGCTYFPVIVDFFCL